MSEFRMPSLGADMEAGTVVEWRVAAGDKVARGDIVALVETEKGLVEVEIFDAGIVESILVAPGTKVPVGTVLATIRSDGRAAASPPVPSTPAAPSPTVSKPPPTPPQPQIATATGNRPLASPLARRLAEQLGVDLAQVTGSGERGAITKADVERTAASLEHAATGPPAPPPQAIPASAVSADRAAAMRSAIAAAMARSKREIPHYYLCASIDMSATMAWLETQNAKRSPADRLLYSAMLLRAVALAVRDVPELNGFWVDGAFRPADGVHIGVAISLRQGGLVAPALHDVDHKSPDEIMRGLLDLVQRARSGVLRSSEVADATITVTNLGDQGVEIVFGVIYPPQVALVGFGRVVDRPWAKDGMVGAHPVMQASLAADHRASDGHRGGRFLTAIDKLLQEPEKL